MENNNRRVPFIKSLRTIVTLAIVIMVAACSTFCIYTGVTQVDKILTAKNGDYINSVLENIITVINTVDSESADSAQYATLIKTVKIKNVASSYGYLVAPDGTMLYHPTESKIGMPVENDVIKCVVSEVQKGKRPSVTVTTYMYNGAEKMAGYAVADDGRILVLTCDYKELTRPLVDVTNYMVMMEFYGVLFYLIIAFFACGLLLAKPINKLTDLVEATAELDLSNLEKDPKLTFRRDEVGVMAKAVYEMREKLKSMVVSINGAGDEIGKNVDSIHAGGEEINEMCSDNSATSQELAAGMEETSATTLSINDTIKGIMDNAEGIKELAKSGAETSDEIMGRAEGLKAKTVEASKNTMDMYEDVKRKSAEAIEGAKSVDKINEMTNTIMEISSQTSLLALNASIEAARAGEAGRGFAVVATEISNLANQTSKTVTEIGAIVGEVNTAVTKMSNCLEETSSFLENTVVKEFGEFENVGVQYQDDANLVKTNMTNVSMEMNALTDAIEEIVTSIKAISDVVGESSMGVSDIAHKTMDIVTKTKENFEMMETCRKSTDTLQGIVTQFKI